MRFSVLLSSRKVLVLEVPWGPVSKSFSCPSPWAWGPFPCPWAYGTWQQHWWFLLFIWFIRLRSFAGSTQLCQFFSFNNSQDIGLHGLALLYLADCMRRRLKLKLTVDSCYFHHWRLSSYVQDSSPECSCLSSHRYPSVEQSTARCHLCANAVCFPSRLKTVLFSRSYLV